MDQGVFSRDSLYIGFDSRLGAGAAVLDGVNMGEGCVLGASAE